jgi:hypothetical protein
MGKSFAAAFFCLVIAAGGAATAQQFRTDCLTGCFDNWLSLQRNTDDSSQWEYQPRFYIPFNLSRGWTFTQRVDLPLSYTDQVGTDNPTGGWKAGINDWFIEEIFATPELAKNFHMWASIRLVFPTGGASPFGSDQYQWAPAVSATYAIPERGITFSPAARYFMSFQATEPSATKIRQLELFPDVTLALPDRWSLAFYSENGISYNAVTNKWFLPIDLMLTKRLTKTIEFGLGGAYGLVKDDPQYDYTIYGRVTVYF